MSLTPPFTSALRQKSQNSLLESAVLEGGARGGDGCVGGTAMEL